MQLYGQYALEIVINGVTALVTVEAMTHESAENKFKKLFSAFKKPIQFNPNLIERL